MIRIGILAVLALGILTAFLFRLARGEDWLVVQYGPKGAATHCWALTDVVLTHTDDGVEWRGLETTGHAQDLYIAIRVERGHQDAAFSLGVDLARCTGTYRDRLLHPDTYIPPR